MTTVEQVEQVGGIVAHYVALFRAPAVSFEAEAAQRKSSTATVHRLRQLPAEDDPALGTAFSLEEVDQALIRMANHKAPGADGVPAELLKYCGPHGKQLLLLFCNLIHESECNPRGWRCHDPRLSR
jgi:hypothetical protein